MNFSDAIVYLFLLFSLFIWSCYKNMKISVGVENLIKIGGDKFCEFI